MCGFAGFIGFGQFSADYAHGVGLSMGDAIAHRGPDDFGVWIDHSSQIVLAHRRLSILDLSPAGHQPMVSISGRYIIAFNGEIYNHLEIRKELHSIGMDIIWRGNSDTETLLAAIECWGLKEALSKSRGMFALALWDRRDRELQIARDRVGEKPLYYGRQGGVLLFGSELKALKKHPAFRGEINRDAIALQLRHSYIPAPYSIYKGIGKLQPGCVLKFSWAQLQTDEEPKLDQYWSFSNLIKDCKAEIFQFDDYSAVLALDKVLRESVRHQLLSDVPLGAFLSGGIDSSAIVSLMQAQSSVPVKTFTIGFDEAGYNEAVHAKAIAQHLGTDHTELYVSSRQALGVIPKLANIYDEPFSDSSQIPTFLVSEMTKRAVSVSLSGDGGDELFGGYNRYFGTQRWWSFIEAVPSSFRKLVARGVMSIPPTTWDIAGDLVGSIFSRNQNYQNLGNKMNKLSGVLSVEDSSALYRHFVSHWSEPESIVINGLEAPTQVTSPTIRLKSIVDQMMALDTLSYLPDDILVKIDRAAMAVSLETRVPFLDHKVVEFAWRLPLGMKIRNGQGKWILKQLLKKYIPIELTDRPKMGFGVPIDIWLRGQLRPWAEALLNESRLHQEGFLKPKLIRKKWEEHLSGERNWQYHLWDVLMFQSWLDSQ